MEHGLARIQTRLATLEVALLGGWVQYRIINREARELKNVRGARGEGQFEPIDLGLGQGRRGKHLEIAVFVLILQGSRLRICLWQSSFA